MARARILVVDDEAAQREIIVYNLEAAGFEVMSADNGEDAVLMVQEEHPNLVVLDWMMPKLSGLEVCRQLRSNKERLKRYQLFYSQRDQKTLIKSGVWKLELMIMFRNLFLLLN